MSYLLNKAIYTHASGRQDASQSDTSIYQRREAPPVPPASAISYELPTFEQLRNSNVVIECSRGLVKRIEPATMLYRPIEDYLPPSGPYFDHYSLEKIFDKNLFFRKDQCLSCWWGKHVEANQACKILCLVCQTKHHLGSECDALYVRMKFWKERNHTPPIGVQIHPCASEFAYLVVAGIFKPAKRLWDPLIVNMKHPLARQFYKDRDEPETLMRQVEVPLKKKMQGPPAVQVETTTSQAVAHEDTFAAPLQSPQPQIKRSSSTLDHAIPDTIRELSDLVAKRNEQETEIAHHRANMVAAKEAIDENARLKARNAQLEETNTHLEENNNHLEEKNRRLEEKHAHLEQLNAQMGLLLSGGSLEEDAPGEKRRRRDDDVGQRHG